MEELPRIKKNGKLRNVLLKKCIPRVHVGASLRSEDQEPPLISPKKKIPLSDIVALIIIVSIAIFTWAFMTAKARHDNPNNISDLRFLHQVRR
jgi:hypothetical protein